MRSKSEAMAGIALIMLASIMAGTTAVGATSEGPLSTDDCPICPDSGMALYSSFRAWALVCDYRNSVDISNCGNIAIWPYDNAGDAQNEFEDMRTYKKGLKDYEILREDDNETVLIKKQYKVSDSSYHYSVSGVFLNICSEKSYRTEVRVNTATKDKIIAIRRFDALAECAKSLIAKKCGEKKEEIEEREKKEEIEEIILKASKEEFIPKEKVLKNSENSKTIRISGTVKPSLVGQTPLKGAKVEIIAGANPTHTYTSDEGFYEITAEVPDGKGEREVSNFDFTLEPEYFIITVTVEPDELPADGLSTAEIKARVTDSEGYPEEGLEIKFKADCPDGEGTIKVTQGTTDSNGIAKAIYTSFKPNGCKHSFGRLFEVTITATEPVHGVEGESILYVTQNELFVWNNAYIPADPKCEFPSELHIILRDIHSNPIADAPIKVKLEGENAEDGTVMPVADSTAVNSEITVYTDGMGCAIAYYKWTGIHNLKNEVVKTVKIIDEKTNACIPEKKIHIGMDLAITGMEPVSFNGGAPGQNAFFRIYITDRMHPDLDLDEFNICSPISAGELPRLNLRLIMKQFSPDFTWDFNEIVTWDKDGQGRTYVKRLESPLTPYVVPLSEGTTWWDVFVDPADCNYKTIIDCDSYNNDIPLHLTTGSSGSNWELFNIWLTNGVLTPHNYAGVVVKCFARFVPYVSTGVSVIDTFNSAYKQDFFDLGRRLFTANWKIMQIKYGDNPTKVLEIQLGQLDKFLRYIYDFKRVREEGGRIVPSWLSSFSCYGFDEIAPLQHENSFEELNALMDKVVHGMISAIPDDIPERRGVIVFNQNIDSVSLTDSGDNIVDDPEMMSSEGGVVVYLVPADETYSLELSTDSSFEIAIYEAGGDKFNRNTYRHEVETAEYLKANLCISNSSDYSLNIDLGGDGSIDEVANPSETILDIEKPTIRNLQPPDGATVSTSTPTISADYADNSDGCGIDIATASIAVDDVDCTEDAMVTASGIRYTPDCLVGGQHNVTVGVSDNDGNYASVEWSFECITSSAKTIYVDDDFTDDPANHRWDTIQEGISDANDGDTVLVYSGTYTETVDLNKRLTLTGEGMPKIDAHGSGDAINITVDNSTVKGFCCVNAQPSSYAGIYVKSNNNVIVENTCEDNYIGIHLSGSSNEITNNVAKNNQYHGIRLWKSDGNIIMDNTAKGNSASGIRLKASDHNRIIDNDASNSVNHHGISLNASNNNEIRNNIANSNHYHGIGLWSSSDYNIITNNTAKGNGECGIRLLASDYNRITDNDASNSVNYHGISIDTSNNNEISNNIANYNHYVGIGLWSSSDNIIAKNTAKDNENKGIYLADSNNNKIYLNNFMDNHDNVYSKDSTNIWHSPLKMTYRFKGSTNKNYLGNYWSDYKGGDSDGDGIGGSAYSIDGDEDICPLMKPWENYFALQVNGPPLNPTPRPECKVQITSDPSDTDRPSIVYGNGFYYVAYQSIEKSHGIYIKKFNSQWNFKKKVEVVSGSAYYDSPSLAFANDKLYVAYISNAEGANKNDYDVIVKGYNPNSFACTSGEKYLTTLQSCQDLPALYYKDGYFYLAYQSWETGNGDIYIKKFDSNWNPLKQVRVTSKSSLQDGPSITYANGYFYVAYYSMETDNRDIFVKRLNSNLNLDVFKKQITFETSRQTYPSIAFVNNQFAIAYASTETGTWGIYMKKYDNNWNFIEKMKVVDDNSAHERRPSIIYAQNDFWIAYVRYLEESDNWYTFVIIPGCE